MDLIVIKLSSVFISICKIIDFRDGDVLLISPLALCTNMCITPALILSALIHSGFLNLWTLLYFLSLFRISQIFAGLLISESWVLSERLGENTFRNSGGGMKLQYPPWGVIFITSCELKKLSLSGPSINVGIFDNCLSVNPNKCRKSLEKKTLSSFDLYPVR